LRVAALKGGIQEHDLAESQPRIHELPSTLGATYDTIHQLKDEALRMNG